MTDVFFYHLQNQPLDKVLPTLLEKSVERGWKVVVEAASPERVDALDSLLWTYSDESFLAHGTDREADAALQPILITTRPDRANGASVRFLVDGAALPADAGSYDRLVLMFDGNDPDAVDLARQQWRDARSGGHACTYWQQNDIGRWEKKA
ncbi:MAG: DNA polymerase III subunit chi [Phreatobacter sp.]